MLNAASYTNCAHNNWAEHRATSGGYPCPKNWSPTPTGTPLSMSCMQQNTLRTNSADSSASIKRHQDLSQHWVRQLPGGAKTVGRYAKTVGQFIGKNGAAIQRGVSITKDLVTAGTTVGQLAGILRHDQKSKIDQIADALYKHAQALGPQKVKKQVRFKGSGFKRHLI